mgnify:CR=1 FL=1
MIKRGQSALIAFLIAIILILLVLVPLYYLIVNYSKPTVKLANFAQVIKNQINGGSVLIFFSSNANSNITLVVLSGNGNFTLKSVYAVYQGIFVNITKYIYAIKITPASKTFIGTLPQPLIYNFTAYNTITLSNGVKVPVWTTTLILEINAYNQTVFATIYPNSTAFS